MNMIGVDLINVSFHQYIYMKITTGILQIDKKNKKKVLKVKAKCLQASQQLIYAIKWGHLTTFV